MLSRSDGSPFVPFPHYRHTNGHVAEPSLDSGGSNARFGAADKVTNLVKYANYPDGAAHFSETGKVLAAADALLAVVRQECLSGLWPRLLL